jgi:hypothetical protein
MLLPCRAARIFTPKKRYVCNLHAAGRDDNVTWSKGFPGSETVTAPLRERCPKAAKGLTQFGGARAVCFLKLA